MTEIEEIDFMMSLDESGVVTHHDNDARVNNLKEWLSTPEGEIYGMPHWGHPLVQFKHEDLDANEDMEVEIENTLLIKLMKDLPKLRISAIKVDSLSIDGFLVVINTPFGQVEQYY